MQQHTMTILSSILKHFSVIHKQIKCDMANVQISKKNKHTESYE